MIANPGEQQRVFPENLVSEFDAKRVNHALCIVYIARALCLALYHPVVCSKGPSCHMVKIWPLYAYAFRRYGR